MKDKAVREKARAVFAKHTQLAANGNGHAHELFHVR